MILSLKIVVINDIITISEQQYTSDNMFVVNNNTGANTPFIKHKTSDYMFAINHNTGDNTFLETTPQVITCFL